MPPGFLAVFSEPGELVSVDEFQDWYNNEHIPLRMSLPSKPFVSCARYSLCAPSPSQAISLSPPISLSQTQTQTQKPSWLALYELTSTLTFSNPEYTSLREKRSEREGDLVRRLEVLDRRCCEVVKDSGEPSSSLGSLSSFSSLEQGGGRWGRWVVSHDFNPPASESTPSGLGFGGGGGLGGPSTGGENEWFGLVVARFSNTEGWVRSRMVRVLDGLRTGVGLEPQSEPQSGVGGYLVLHEFSSSQSSDDAIKMLSESSACVGEVRKWEVYRVYGA